MMETILEVDGLTVDIPVAAGMLHAVRDVSFTVHRGETLCIVGESGCGKSLTSLAIMGLLPRKASLNPSYTIGNQLEEMLKRHRKASTREARERAIFLLEKVGITSAASRLSQYPHQLSGGLRQRVMIAMTLMCDPDLLMADEPTTALDVTIQAQILLLLADLQREFNMGLILITHDLGIVARVADRVAVMYAGQIVESGTVKQIFENPTHPYTQGLLECIPIPGKTPPGAHLGSIPGIVPALVGEQRGCGFAERCGYVETECAARTVDFRAAPDTGHVYRCVLGPDRCAANHRAGSTV
jgi:peptide/nickel transport system ATP-binding protein